MKKKFNLKLFTFSFFLTVILFKKNIFQLLLRKYINIIDVSIILPIFNSEKYLNPCLKSITEQSLKNIEIIGIDDGSIDNSPKILREFQKKDKRL